MTYEFFPTPGKKPNELPESATEEEIALRPASAAQAYGELAGRLTGTAGRWWERYVNEHGEGLFQTNPGRRMSPEEINTTYGLEGEE